MKTFIVVYMIANEIVGIFCMGWYINYLKSIDYFEQRKIEKWFKKHDKKNKFFEALDKINRELEKADSENEETYFVRSYWEPQPDKITLDEIDACLNFNQVPSFICDYKRKLFNEVLDNHKCKLDYSDYYSYY